MEFFIFIVLVLLVIISSGIISGTEAALLSISYTKVKDILNNSKSKKKLLRAKYLLQVKEDIQKYITSIVVLNNVINIMGSIYIGILASKFFGEAVIGVVSAVLTFLIIMFSEIIPKIFGEKHCVSISLFVAGPLIVVTKILTPVNFMLEKISGFFIKGKSKNNISEGEIKEMASLGHQEGAINAYENEVIKNVFKMDDIEVYDIMIPKSKVVLIDENTSYNEIIKLIEKTGFTRFPIAKDGEVIGLINAKDLFKFHSKVDKFSVSKIIRPIVFAPESMKIFSLEQKLKKSRIHMAVIVNEYGDFTGIVTLEDIIEELLGEIEDEFDKEKKSLIKKISPKKYLIDANCELSLINKKLGLNLPEDEDYMTLNGFLISKLDKIPRVNESLEIEEGVFRVTNTSKRKVLKVEFIFRVKNS